jgi:tetratricopeptide (TPR) repeat protein
MKKTAIFLMVLMVGGMTFGQNSKVVSAYNYLRNLQLKEAKEAIDPAVEHPKTMSDAKAWFYRGNVYLAIMMSEDPEVRALAENALSVAEESYNKALELDDKDRYKAEIIERIPFMAEQYYNQGVQLYNVQEFDKAMQSFIKARETNARVGREDSLALFNAALCAELAEKNTEAKKYYNELIQLGYEGEPNAVPLYISLSRIHKAEKDTTGAIAVIRKGLERYPGEFNLLIEETNIHLSSGNVVEAQKNLEKAIEVDATNPTIFFAVGTTYDQMGDMEKAAEAYKNAVELNAEYFDANYNLGALYVNEAAAIIEEANQLPLGDPKYDVAKKKADDMLLEALPYLEKANQIDPKELNTLVTLKEIYARTNQLEKLQQVNEAIKNLNQ